MNKTENNNSSILIVDDCAENIQVLISILGTEK
jgi:hypothetical protein